MDRTCRKNIKSILLIFLTLSFLFKIILIFRETQLSVRNVGLIDTHSGGNLQPEVKTYETIWNTVDTSINENGLYTNRTPIDRITSAMVSARITGAWMFAEGEDLPHMNGDEDFGSSYKWLLALQGSRLAIFKPKW